MVVAWWLAAIAHSMSQDRPQRSPIFQVSICNLLRDGRAETSSPGAAGRRVKLFTNNCIVVWGCGRARHPWSWVRRSRLMGRTLSGRKQELSSTGSRRQSSGEAVRSPLSMII